MPLTGIEIFKLLPRTNCGQCGVPTCLAFAMNLAAGKAELSSCPHVSEEAKAKLEEASAPPIRPVTIGAGDGQVKVGGETVLFRHEKRFESPTAIAMLVRDDMPGDEIAARLQKFRTLRYERVGLILKPDMVAVEAASGDPERFAQVAARVHTETGGAAMILMSDQPPVLARALEAVPGSRPLLYGVTVDNLEAMLELAKAHNAALGVKGDSIEGTIAASQKLLDLGCKNVVLDGGARSLKTAFDEQVAIRRAALLQKFRPLGFPTIVFPCRMTDDPMKEALIAATFIAKYGGIVVLSDLEGHSLFPLLVARLNIFTDPQRPMSTGEGIYPIGTPDDKSPVLVTSNFSLTYFIVSGEIENSRVPAWLLVQDTEGLSVLTAWAAGKFVADTIAALVKKSGIADRVSHRRIVIPGHLAAESGALEDELKEWQVLVGPREGAHIPAYLKNWQAA
ncbi:MAG: acetyl-CoA decarbonylase/synthase complex subunit gamma [Bacillota bacterium]